MPVIGEVCVGSILQAVSSDRCRERSYRFSPGASEPMGRETAKHQGNRPRGRFIDRHDLTLAGDRPVVGPVLTGLAGLVGGYVIGHLGGRVALAIMGPFELGDPMDLFGNAIRSLIPMMVFAAGAVVGFLVGTVVVPMLLMLGLAWNEAGRTVVYLLLLLLGVVPLTLLLIFQVSGNVDTPESNRALLWFAATVVGGLTPAAARRLAIRNRQGDVTSRPH